MLKIFKSKRAQNTAEYAILIALVIGGVVAMQTYAQRTLQGRIRDAAVKFKDETNMIGNTLQYEPYYTNTATDTVRESTKIDSWANRSDISSSVKTNASIDRTEYKANAIQGYNAATGF
jgi:hypothetical protein